MPEPKRPLKPTEEQAAADAARLGTCRPWIGDDALEAEFRRTAAGLGSRGLATGLKAILNHVGETWESRTNGRPVAVESDEIDPATNLPRGYHPGR